MILGHACQYVIERVAEQLAKGSLLPGPSPLLEELVSRLGQYYPSAEAGLAFKTGSEAVAATIRLARAATGRTRVLRVGFHGWHDELVDPSVGWHNYDNHRTAGSTVLGVPEHGRAVRVTTWLESSIDGLANAIQGSEDLAAVVIDPIQCTGDIRMQLRAVKLACRAVGTLLVMDETKTALRIHPGGVQGLYGVAADLTVAGKALANGLPLSLVLGPAEVVGYRKRARVKGTFGEERLALTAAHATLDVLERQNAWSHLEAIGELLIETLNECFARAGVAGVLHAVPYRWPAMPHVHASSDSPSAVLFRSSFVTQLAAHGVLMLDGHNSFVCLAHTRDDVEATAHSTHEALEVLARSQNARGLAHPDHAWT